MQLIASQELPEESIIRPYLSVAFVLCPGFTATPLACFSDALRLAADHHDNSSQVFFKWGFASAAKKDVVSSSGLEIHPNISLEQAADYDCLVICGGLIREFKEIDPRVHELIRNAHSKNRTIVGMCTGAFVVAQTGLLERKKCAVQANVLEDFKKLCPTTIPLTRINYCIEGSIITCPGGVLSVDVAAHIIETSSNHFRTLKALDYLLFDYENPRSTFPKRTYQEKFDLATEVVRNAIRLMESGVGNPYPIDTLSNKVGTTKSTLTRQFKKDIGISPAGFWLTIRLEFASRLLLESRQKVTEIAYKVGFADTAHFCKVFKLRFGATPRDYRLNLNRTISNNSEVL